MNLRSNCLQRFANNAPLRIVVSLMLAGHCASAFSQKAMSMGSSSMAPTFAMGDTLKINLFAYMFSSPARWEVVTFRSPDGKTFLTKRVVGVPGDSVTYDSKKRLKINGAFVTLDPISLNVPTENPGERSFVESLDGEQHLIQVRDGATAVVGGAVEDAFRGRERCRFSQGGISCTVPRSHLFVLGDNRDSSRDSRHFGLIPEEDVGGRVENAPPVPAKR